MRTSLTDRADSETPPVSLRLSGGIIMDVDWSMFLVRPGKRINSMGCFFATRGPGAERRVFARRVARARAGSSSIEAAHSPRFDAAV